MLEKAKTKLEKKAYKEAREDVIKSAVSEKAAVARCKMMTYVSKINQVADLREKADAVEKKATELASILGVTKEDKDQLFGDSFDLPHIREEAK